MHYVYILKSKKTKKHYIGSSNDVAKRLQQHNNGSTRSTKHGIPWEIIYTESLETKPAALERERQIKSYKGGRAFKALLE